MQCLSMHDYLSSSPAVTSAQRVLSTHKGIHWLQGVQAKCRDPSHPACHRARVLKQAPRLKTPLWLKLHTVRLYECSWALAIQKLFQILCYHQYDCCKHQVLPSPGASTSHCYTANRHCQNTVPRGLLQLQISKSYSHLVSSEKLLFLLLQEPLDMTHCILFVHFAIYISQMLF